MLARLGLIAVLSTWIPASLANAEPVGTLSISVAEYAARLDAFASAVNALDERHPEQADAVLSDIPTEYHLNTPNGAMTVASAWLRQDLDAWRRHPESAARMRLVDRLRLVMADAVSFQGSAPDTSSARTALTAILASPEFQDAQQPTWLQRIGERVWNWLVLLLGRVFGSSVIKTIPNVLVYGFIGLAVVLVAIWMYRTLRRGSDADAALLGTYPIVPRPWNGWLLEARSAATNGDWRQAIHLAYWCGIAFLESEGAWRPDMSRTPREYLRLLAAADDRAPALGGLTRLFEHVWYGSAPGDAAGFDEALAQLKRLGCPSI